MVGGVCLKSVDKNWTSPPQQLHCAESRNLTLGNGVNAVVLVTTKYCGLQGFKRISFSRIHFITSYSGGAGF